MDLSENHNMKQNDKPYHCVKISLHIHQNKLNNYHFVSYYGFRKDQLRGQRQIERLLIWFIIFLHIMVFGKIHLLNGSIWIYRF